MKKKLTKVGLANIFGAIVLLTISVFITIKSWNYYVDNGAAQSSTILKKDVIRPKTVSGRQLFWGLIVSAPCGGVFIWFLMEKFLWWHVVDAEMREKKPKLNWCKKWLMKGADSCKLRGTEKCDYRYTLTFWMGLVERALYTLGLFSGFPHWIPFWIGVKVASVRREGPVHYNMFLIGNLLSLFFGFLGAWIALGELPFFNLVGRLK